MSNALHECLAQPQLVRMFLVLVQSHVNSSNMLALIRSSILWAGCAVVSFFFVLLVNLKFLKITVSA